MALRSRCLQFDEYRLYPAEHRLQRNGKTIPLAPKAFEIFLFLVENASHLVTRDEIMKAVWPDSFVEETNLTVNISLLRRALGKAPSGEDYIETVPRKGYRFAAVVTEMLDGHPPGFAATPSPPPDNTLAPTPTAVTRPAQAAVTTPDWKPAALRLALLSLLLVGIAIAYFYFPARRRIAPAPVDAGVRSIAILPLQLLNSDTNDEYLALGMTDALITRVGTLHQIVVRPIGAVRKFGPQQDPIAAGRLLSVDLVLEGTFQRIADRTRFTVRLLRVKDGELVWGDKFDDKLTDMFAVEDSISQKLAAALALRLSQDEQQQFSRPYTHDSAAYQFYFQGRYFWNKRTSDGVKKSLDYFQQAIQADPQYALAYAGLADSYILAGSYGLSFLPPKEAMPKAQAAAERALELDPTLAEARTSLAYIKFTYNWDWPGAEKEFRQAIALNPRYDNAHHWYSHFLMAMGRPAEAMAESRHALDLSPSDVVLNEHLCWTFMMEKQYEPAIEQCRQTIDMDPSFNQAHRVLGLAYAYTGQFDAAVGEFQRGVELSKDDPVAQAYLARAYGLQGQRQKALSILQTLEHPADNHYLSSEELAAAYTALGDNNRALTLLEKAYDERASALIYLKVDRALDPLRPDPRFKTLLTRLNLQ